MAAPMAETSRPKKETGEDVFMAHFKYYKSRNPFPNLSGVLDFSADFFHRSQDEIRRTQLTTPVIPPLSSLKPVEQWEVFTHKLFPGFTFIQNPFRDECQSYWVHRCIEEYPMKPNVTNLDAHMNIDPNFNIWHESIHERMGTTSFEKTLIYKLRWVTLGYHHDWNTKKYDSVNMTPFPEDMQILSQYISTSLGWSQYKAEAAIVNYYHLDSTLAGHTDHSELDHQSPLISISFGQTALFMLGGLTKAALPITMYLRSGDIVVMEGPARLSFHAIPKILPESCNVSRFIEGGYLPTQHQTHKDFTHSTHDSSVPCLSATEWLNHKMYDVISNIDRTDLWEYLRTSRINMNIRQVLPEGETFPLEKEVATENVTEHRP